MSNKILYVTFPVAEKDSLIYAMFTSATIFRMCIQVEEPEKV